MSFNMESIKVNASVCLNNLIAKVPECVAELQENPSEFLKTNVKMVLVATALFTSLVLAPIFTAAACIAGILYSKTVSKVEGEFIDFFINSSLEGKIISVALLASVLLFAGKIVLPLGIGAHVGMLLSNSCESAGDGKVLDLSY